MLALFAADFTSINRIDHSSTSRATVWLDHLLASAEADAMARQSIGRCLLEHLQFERIFNEAIHGAKGGEGALHGRGLAGLDGDDEGQRVLGIAGLLHDGANIDAFFGEGAGDFGDDAGTIDDGEADVMRTSNSAPRRAGSEGISTRRESWARASRSLTTATAVDDRRRRDRKRPHRRRNGR